MTPSAAGSRRVDARWNAIVAGVCRGGIEARRSLTDVADLFGWVFFPGVSLLVMYFLRDVTVPGLELSLGAQAIPGILGMNVVFIAVLGLSMALTVDRGDGTLLRAKATPHGVLGYLVGKVTTQAAFSIAISVVLLVAAAFLFDGLATARPSSWPSLIGVLVLGLVATLPWGAIVGSLFRNPQSLSFVSLLLMGLIAVSGVFYPLTALPGWVQVLGQVFPVYWLGLGMRHALLPDSAAAAEITGTWRELETLAALGGWAVVGFLLAPLVLGRMTRRATGASITTDPRHTVG